jgi:hypothetical protein
LMSEVALCPLSSEQLLTLPSKPLLRGAQPAGVEYDPLANKGIELM